MDAIILRLGIQQLKARAALCDIICASLGEKYRSENLSREEKDSIAMRWGAALIDGNALRAQLERLEQE